MPEANIMDKRVTVILVILIACASMLALGCTSSSNTGSSQVTATPEAGYNGGVQTGMNVNSTMMSPGGMNGTHDYNGTRMHGNGTEMYGNGTNMRGYNGTMMHGNGTQRYGNGTGMPPGMNGTGMWPGNRSMMNETDNAPGIPPVSI